MFPALQADSLPSETPRKPTTTRDIYKEYGLGVVKGNLAKACVPLFLSGPENICLPNFCFFGRGAGGSQAP